MTDNFIDRSMLAYLVSSTVIMLVFGALPDATAAPNCVMTQNTLGTHPVIASNPPFPLPETGNQCPMLVGNGCCNAIQQLSLSLFAKTLVNSFGEAKFGGETILLGRLR